MGLNIETLVIILGILTLAILGDGVRRMIKDRQTQLRLSKDVEPFADENYENPELPTGGARVVSREQEAQEALQVPQTEPQTDAQPPFTEPTQTLSAGVQQPAPEPAPVEEKPAPQPSEPEAADPLFSTAKRPAKRQVAQPQEPAPAAAKGLSEVIVVHLVAPQGYTFGGEGMLQMFESHGLKYGDMNIFHVMGEGAESNVALFSMANAQRPGTFDVNTVDQQDFKGFTFFMELPGPSHPLNVLNKMLATVESMSRMLGAEMKDEHRSVLTPQTMEHLRERIREYERRSRLVQG